MSSNPHAAASTNSESALFQLHILPAVVSMMTMVFLALEDFRKLTQRTGVLKKI